MSNSFIGNLRDSVPLLKTFGNAIDYKKKCREVNESKSSQSELIEVN